MKLIVLDRDGVINEDSPDFIKSPDEWLPIVGSIEAIARLTRAQYHVVVFTNQSGVGRGLFSLDTLNDIHAKMHRLVAEQGGRIDAIYYCPHAPDEGCDCRKPKAGMLVDISRRLRIDLTDVPVVGDSLRDLQSAQKVGARAILVRSGKGAAVEKAGVGLTDVPVYDTLLEVVDHLLAQTS